MANEITRRTFVGAALVLAVGAGVGAGCAFESPVIGRPSTKMGVGTMKALVVYGTKSGCTQGVAERIGKDLADRGVTAEVVAAEKAGDPAGYDAVVVGSGVRVGQWHGAAKTWVESNAAALKKMPVAFFTCGMTMTDSSKAEEVRAYTDPILAATGIKPVDIGLFAGWYQPDKFGFAERTILKLMKTPQGDFRDWAAIDAWTEKIGATMGLPA